MCFNQISSGRKIENTRINNIHHNCGERNKKRKEIETFNRNTKQKSFETIKPNHQTIETRSFHSRNRTKLATDSIRNARNNSKSIDELILIENNQTTNGNRQSNKASNIDRIHSPPPPPPPPPSSSNESNLANPQLIENLQIVKPNLKVKVEMNRREGKKIVFFR
ncbi:hypothetical protein NH340_JMT04608 [Sarcoptes scabiei]|nr:hypothetical protein NH340_JMT04608 [Sarcoptes scabiei]